MPKIIRPGKVVILLKGRYAGKKAVVLKSYDEGNDQKKFGHALVVGIEKHPLKVTKNMSAALLKRRSRIKPFTKLVNYNHVMPTRYGLDVQDLNNITIDSIKEPAQRKQLRKDIKKSFNEKYLSGKNNWFFQKLRF